VEGPVRAEEGAAPSALPLRPRGSHQEVEVGDASVDEGHPGMIQEALDVHPPPGGEIVDDHDVVVLS